MPELLSLKHLFMIATHKIGTRCDCKTAGKRRKIFIKEKIVFIPCQVHTLTSIFFVMS